VVGRFHVCALLSDASLKCWGHGYGTGELGLGTSQNIGDDELPSSVGPISVTTTAGVQVVQVVAGSSYTCALLSDHSVKCWGQGQYGVLGQGNTANIGDNELPSSVPPIQF
jgi:alpha-tubulin suppressor-like RCC1 family protein